ncbi:MOS1T transposase, partial [Pseudoatta argentina]
VAETNGLRMLELIVPQHAVLGQNVSLECNFNLDGEKLYSVKWYKDGNEFYRYVPREKPPVLVFLQPGVSAVVHESTQRMVVLRSVNLMSTGRYRCEVSAEAPSFQTVSDHSDMTIIALPEDEPVITARPGKHRYQVGDVVRFNCTSTRSKPHATLSWFINGDPVEQQFLKSYPVDVDRNDLETSTLGLEFRLRLKHFKKGDLKIKCLARIYTVYWKSNELSIEGERPLKIPVIESRETRAQGHTYAEHILASGSIASGPCVMLVIMGLLMLRYTRACTSFEYITGDRYRLQLMRLSRALKEKRPLYAQRHDKVILLHDNARPHVAKPVKTYLETLKWEVLPHPLYSPDIAPSDFHLFCSQIHCRIETSRADTWALRKKNKSRTAAAVMEE